MKTSSKEARHWFLGPHPSPISFLTVVLLGLDFQSVPSSIGTRNQCRTSQEYRATVTYLWTIFFVTFHINYKDYCMSEPAEMVYFNVSFNTASKLKKSNFVFFLRYSLSVSHYWCPKNRTVPGVVYRRGRLWCRFRGGRTPPSLPAHRVRRLPIVFPGPINLRKDFIHPQGKFFMYCHIFD